MLKGVEAVVDEAGDPLAGGVCGNDPARLAGPIDERDGRLLGHNAIVGEISSPTYSHRAIVLQQADIAVNTLVGPGDLGRGQLSDRAGRGAHGQGPGWDLPAFG